MKPICATLTFLVIVISSALHAADDKPRTNWGAVMKVPVEKMEAVDQALINWGNWIKETHPLGPEDENNLDNVSITRSEPFDGQVYYVIVEVYPTTKGLENHQRIYQQTNSLTEYEDVFAKLRSVVGPYFISGATQRKTVYNLVPSKNH
jgi:hypothetical protein